MSASGEFSWLLVKIITIWGCPFLNLLSSLKTPICISSGPLQSWGFYYNWGCTFTNSVFWVLFREALTPVHRGSKPVRSILPWFLFQISSFLVLLDVRLQPERLNKSSPFPGFFWSVFYLATEKQSKPELYTLAPTCQSDGGNSSAEIPSSQLCRVDNKN